MITGLRLPIDWEALGFPTAMSFGALTVWSGLRAWQWDVPPDLSVLHVGESPEGRRFDGWGIDHVVLLVPDLVCAGEAIEAVAGPSRRTMEVGGRPTSFWVVGTLLEVVEQPSVDRPLLYGVSLETAKPLATVASEWRGMGFDVSDPRPAVQIGRSILVVRGLGAGLAVMSPRVAVGTLGS